MFSNESLTQLLENLKRNFLVACEASLAYEVFAHPVQRFSTADLGKVPGELEVSIARGPSLAALQKVEKEKPRVKQRLDVAQCDSRFIYLFKFCDTNVVTADEIFETLAPYKSPRAIDGQDEGQPSAKLALPQLNLELHQPNYLYVGGSAGNAIGKRLYAHLGAKPSTKTYGMQLGQWAQQLDLRLELHVHEFRSALSEPMQLVEDATWLSCLPVLGKMGGR